MKHNRFAVYAPPADKLPYFAVMILASGAVSAQPFDTREEATAHNEMLAESLYGRKPGPAPRAARQ